jgi:hypothetical protein
VPEYPSSRKLRNWEKSRNTPEVSFAEISPKPFLHSPA